MRLLILALLVMAGCWKHRYPTSDHFNGYRFKSPWGVDNHMGFVVAIQWMATRQPVEWPLFVPYEHKPLHPAPQEGMIVTWINHATLLIQVPGLNILTDPVYSERCGPLSFMGPKRAHEPGIPWDKLPKIDVVVISHNHSDHLDVYTAEALEARDKPLFLVPLGDKAWLKRRGLTNVEEMDWWQTRTVNGTDLTFTPNQHWSARWLFDWNESLWGGWWIAHKGQTLYFAGDTGFGPHFGMIREKMGPADIALLSIGAYEPLWLNGDMHMTPEQALDAQAILGAPKAIGMHFGTFRLTDEGINEPGERLIANRTKRKLPPESFAVPSPGESFVFPPKNQ